MADLAPQAKKQKLDQPKVIGTHNGTFHCDEALAVFLLRQTATYHDSEVKRTRDPAILDTCDIVVDVGAVYDEGKQRFDHHQRGFTEVFGHGFETKLSSAGLVYKHFGKEIIAKYTQRAVEDPEVQTLWLKLYREFIEGVDGIDNGVQQYATEIKPKYRLRTDLSSRVSHLNPRWNQSFDSDAVDAQFFKASALTGGEFIDRLDYYANAWLPAREILISSLEKSRAEIDSSGRIILFETFMPWKEHLFELEESSVIPSTALYVVYPGGGEDWRVQCVPVSPESFENRKSLPEKWRGLRDAELSEASGVDGCIFIHAGGFTGGNKTQAGAMKLAQLALEL